MMLRYGRRCIQQQQRFSHLTTSSTSLSLSSGVVDSCEAKGLLDGSSDVTYGSAGVVPGSMHGRPLSGGTFVMSSTTNPINTFSMSTRHISYGSMASFSENKTATHTHNQQFMPQDDVTERSTTQEHVMPHPGMSSTDDHSTEENYTANDGSYWLMQPVYDKEYLESIKPKHRRPKSFHDYTGYYGVSLLRKSFDLVTGYGPNMTHSKWMTRFLFLETVAGVPGMVGAMLRHLRSLRTMQRDNGWIHTLLEEAENERMHLLTFMQMKNPGWMFRAAVIGTQGVFLSLYSLFYAVSPRHCHAFVSYLEEEAVKTYTHAIDDLESGKIPEWKNMEAPFIAKKYWRLGEKANMRDLLLAIRADEACHNHVNAVFAEMSANDPNPFAPGTTQVQ